MKTEILVIGSGFSGATCARSLAESGYKVVVLEKRNHIGGNAYDHLDENGVLIHPYGPHIFHTNSEKIFDWLSRFTDWMFYEHRVLSLVENILLPIPINRVTINNLYNLDLDENGVKEFLQNVKINKNSINNSEDLVLSSVGDDLCNKFFRGYTKKQWGLELNELSVGVAARIPTRTGDDDRYFEDKYQYMPKNGYHNLFLNMLNHENIEVIKNVDFFEMKSKISYEKLIYTGPIDRYFEFQFGKLPYRSLKFERKNFKQKELIQKTATINYPNDFEYTRSTEFRHITGQACETTSITYEYPCADGEPFYPIPREENNKIFKKYSELSERLKDVYFVGRLAEYKYYNMDQVIASALKTSEKIKLELA